MKSMKRPCSQWERIQFHKLVFNFFFFWSKQKNDQTYNIIIVRQTPMFAEITKPCINQKKEKKRNKLQNPILFILYCSYMLPCWYEDIKHNNV